MSSELHSTSKHACIIEEFFNVILLSILPLFQCCWSNCLAFKPWPLSYVHVVGGTWHKTPSTWVCKVKNHASLFPLFSCLHAIFPPTSCDDSLSLESVTGEEEGDQKRWTQAHTISGIEVLVPQQAAFSDSIDHNLYKVKSGSQPQRTQHHAHHSL
jgi:hypothetical protein